MERGWRVGSVWKGRCVPESHFAHLTPPHLHPLQTAGVASGAAEGARHLGADLQGSAAARFSTTLQARGLEREGGCVFTGCRAGWVPGWEGAGRRRAASGRLHAGRLVEGFCVKAGELCTPLVG